MKDALRSVLEANQKKNIVFYGISQDKCRLRGEELQRFHAFYMDVDMPIDVEESCHIKSFEQLVEMQIDAVVVMRQMIAHQGAFRQILEYSKAYNADIYDEMGRNIGVVCREAIEKNYCDKATLLREIGLHNYISFDIFDTLLTRKVLLPEDVFALAEKRLANVGIEICDFKKKRLEAQSELGLTNPDIDEIYENFQAKYQISEEEARKCKEIELQIEREVLIPRAEMLEVYQQCVADGKRVSLVSDMYIPERFLVPILEQNGITEYEKIYISCDKKQLKLQGLLETYRRELAQEGSYLHIGDHVIHDGICAGLAGIDYCLVENSYKAALRTEYAACIEVADSLEEHVMLGLSIAKVLNSPFAVREEDGKVQITSDYEYAYGFYAAVVSQFAMFLYEEIKRGQYDDVLFAARDGYLMQQMYEMLRDRRGVADEQMPKGKYFYTSRKAAVMTCINNEAYINMLIDISPNMEPRTLMRERFGLNDSQLLKVEAEHYESIHKYVWAHVDAIFKRSEEAKRNYFKYMGNINLKIGGKYAFMDFVSSGTSQKSLACITPFDIRGVYAGWNSEENQEEVGVKALFNDTSTYFLQNYKMIETFMSSEEPSLSHFDEDGNPVFQKMERDEKELAYVREMQRACKDFFTDFLNIVGDSVEHIDNNFTDRVFAMSDAAVVLEEESVLNHISLMDDWQQVRLQKAKMIQDYGRR